MHVRSCDTPEGTGDILYASDTFTPRFNIGCDILVDALKGNAIITKIRCGGEVEVVYVASETSPKAERKLGLKITNLGDG